MNLAHLHLLLNHLPVLGSAFGLGLLAFGLWRRSDELKKVALGVFAIVAVAAVPVYLTGQPAEEIIESLPGVSMPVIEQHESAAGLGFVAILGLGMASLTGLSAFRNGNPLPVWFDISVLVAALIVCGLMAWTANLGGQIRHSEIRTNSSAPAGAESRRHDD